MKKLVFLGVCLLFVVPCQAGIIIVDPNSGEQLIAGQTKTIIWNTVGDINNVKIEFSDSNGQTWTDVNSSIPNSGSYNWTLPQVTSNQCLIRISDANNADVNDTSDNIFSVYVCQLNSPADMDRNCKVDFVDFSIFAKDWLRNGNPFDGGYTEGPAGMVWVSIDDSGAGMKDRSGNPISHGGFTGYMSKYETTNAQYCQFLNAAIASGDITVSGNRVYGASGSNGGADFVGQVYFDTLNYTSYSQITWNGTTFTVRSRDGYSMANHPVVEVSWYGATAFCNYYGYRLPTEWEWQAVADYDGSYTYGCGTTINQSKANYYDNGYANPLGLSSWPYTSPVDYYPSYGYGMNDMAGNVWEWTSSCYYAGCDYGYRVIRGGGWYYDANYCTVSYRYYDYPLGTHNGIGFRVCR